MLTVCVGLLRNEGAASVIRRKTRKQRPFRPIVGKLPCALVSSADPGFRLWAPHTQQMGPGPTQRTEGQQAPARQLASPVQSAFPVLDGLLALGKCADSRGASERDEDQLSRTDRQETRVHSTLRGCTAPALCWDQRQEAGNKNEQEGPRQGLQPS